MSEKPAYSRTDSSVVEAAIPEMAKLYESGMTVLAIASMFGFAYDTVRARLVEAGVQMRPSASQIGRAAPKPRRSAEGRRPPLSAEEVERLRKLVGYRPGQT